MNINLLMLMELLEDFRQKLSELLAVKQYHHVQNHLCRHADK